jgi:uncharacterized membrane protein
MRLSRSTSDRTPASAEDRRAEGLAFLALAVSLSLALASKLTCIDQTRAGEPERHWCFSDIKALWSERGFDVEATPYADPPRAYPVDYVFEYPPGIAYPAYGLARLVDSRLSYFIVTALTLAASAFLSLWLLSRVQRATGGSQRRLMILAASPGLVVFAFHTWDLWSVVPAAGGLAAAAYSRRNLAGALFGLGAAVKWWPGLLLVTVLWGPWARRDGAAQEGLRGLAARFTPSLIALALWGLVQLPAWLIDGQNWWASMRLHLARRPNTDSLFHLVALAGRRLWPSAFWTDGYTTLATLITFALLFAGIAYVARRLHQGRLAPTDAALLLVIVFLLSSKVFSPQFILWLLPVAVISRPSWPRILAVDVPNALVWILLAGAVFELRLFQAAVVIRTVALAWLAVFMFRQVRSAGHHMIAA